MPKKKLSRPPRSTRPTTPLVFFLIGIGFLFLGMFVGMKASIREDVIPSTILPGNAEYLFIQNAASGTFAPEEKNSKTYTLLLSNVSPRTLVFADRPKRIVESMDLKVFLDKGWDFTTGASRSSEPPTAILMVHNEEKRHEEAVALQLTNPQYDELNNILSYTATLLQDGKRSRLHIANDSSSKDFPETMTNPVLFIDSWAGQF